MLDTLHRRHGRAALTIALLVLAIAPALAVAQRTAATHATAAKPTIVLEHGAFADASGWYTVTQRLQRRGYTVLAPANPLRGVTSDATSLRLLLATITGPIVLVGHSYGGFVITNAATGNPPVKALVYIAAYAPDEGDTVQGINTLGAGGSMLGPTTLLPRPYIAADGTQQLEAYIKPSVFREVFAADVPTKTADLMAAAQRPAALATLGQPSGPPAWKTIPSWYLVAGHDNAIGTSPERVMAARMHAHTTEIARASHAVMVSHPAQTTKVILAAATATGG
jgi:pimeloyl-ACP methyl ester carboxylesterase